MTAVLTRRHDRRRRRPDDVRDVLARSILADGLDFVLDIDRSSGSYLVDARTGERYLDMFTFFASSALGMNHPALADDEDFRAELAQAAVNKPSNSDVYSVPMARFVDTFARVLGDPALPHLFFVDGGALAVENALKVAFDWKSRHNEARGLDPGARHQGAAPARRIPRPQRLHAVADQHRPEQGRAVPEVRLAAHRRAVHPARCRHGCGRGGVAAHRRARRSRRTRTTSPASSPSRSRARAATGTSVRSSSPRCASCATSSTRC